MLKWLVNRLIFDDSKFQVSLFLLPNNCPTGLVGPYFAPVAGFRTLCRVFFSNEDVF